MIDQRENWWDDDPEWQELRRRIDNQPAPKKPRQAPEQKPINEQQPKREIITPAKKVQVTLNMKLPSVRLPRPTLPKGIQLRTGLIITGIITAGIVSLLVLKPGDNSKSSDGKGILGENVQQPSFDTLLPRGKVDEIDNEKIGFDAEKQVASFTDKIVNTDVTVSQQPLPDSFKHDPDGEVAKLAKNINANTVLIESNPKAYIGTSIKGPQTVVFQRNDVLVFIQSSRKIDDDTWAQYVKELL